MRSDQGFRLERNPIIRILLVEIEEGLACPRRRQATGAAPAVRDSGAFRLERRRCQSHYVPLEGRARLRATSSHRYAAVATQCGIVKKGRRWKPL